MGGRDVSPSAALRLALAGAWHVVRGRSLGQFPRVLGLLEAVGRAAPGAVRFRHGARLRLGLQAAVVVRMLEEAQPDGKIFDAIDSFFPEGEAPAAAHGQATPRELAMVGEAQESFRELVLGLLADHGRREAYLQGPAGEEYGRHSCRPSSTSSTSICSGWRAPCPAPTCGSSMRWCGATPLPDPTPVTCQS
ncbi:TERF1-interacting nuclear factor 2 [Phalacrocorax aristotelis]|uniref:TERF1-interacting nuclear factor 2 n=1 Tax=Phalacrocorax aristotelis TaxID=126867 RepID=UPI003F4B9849